jgi:hypothetical protein
MSKWSKVAGAFAPWAGLVVGLLALALVHQIGSEGTFNDCRANSPGPIIIIGLLGLLACSVSGLASWRDFRSGQAGATRRVIGAISVGCVALFAFAILLPMIASMMLPPCFQ